MKITPYGGAGEIGGNKFLLETAGTRVFIDFGEPFDRGVGFYDGMEYFYPRGAMGLKDFFEFDMMPRIDGVYSKKALKHTDLAYSEPAFDGILVSHIHCDHFGDIQWVDKKIPVYMGKGAKELNDIYNQAYSYLFRRYDNGNVKPFETGECIKIKDIEVTPIHVDHSTPAAYGFIIKTPEGTIAYTGDFRMHGYMPEMTKDFIKAAAKAKVDVLMTEGTRVKMDKKEEDPFKKKLTETQVMEMMYESIKTADGITLADFSVKNIDRLRTCTDLPIAAGFGISDGAQAREAARHADAVVVGSALVEAARTGRLAARVRELAAAVHGV